MELKKGEIKVWALFEVLATKAELSEKALKEHIANLESEGNVKITKKVFEKIQEIEKPHPTVEKGYSQICEIEFIVTGFSKLIDIMLNYGPSMVEVLAPDKLEVTMGDLQDGLNSVAGMMHKFLESGLGGMIIIDKE